MTNYPTSSREAILYPISYVAAFRYKPGSLHFHPNEQITWITKGSVKVLSQGKEFIVKAGGVLIIPPNVPHEFFALEIPLILIFLRQHVKIG